MEKYDYYAAVRKDIFGYLAETDHGYIPEEYKDEFIYDILENADSVTGNASGSYFCNTWKAEECLCHNWDLIQECIDAEYLVEDAISRGAEVVDVIIRCYVLGQIGCDVVDEWNADHPANPESDE